MRTLLGSLVAALLAVAPLTTTAGAQAIVSKGQSFVEARLLPGEMEGGVRLAGLLLDIAKGWKTYWRNPGEIGIPPTFDWSASRNVASVEVLWPRPDIFSSFGVQTVGYGGRVVLPLLVTPIDPEAEIMLAVTADLGVCREICVLERFSLDEVIPARQSIAAHQIEQAHATVPRTNDEAGLVEAVCNITGRGEKRRIAMSLGFDRAVMDPVVMIDSSDRYWVSGVESRQSAPDRVEIVADLNLESPSVWVTRGDLRATILADGYAAEMRGCRAPAD